MTELALDRADVAGGLQSLTLLASAAGGLLFGVLADRWGRTRALMLSVLLYSIFTAACGFAQTAAQLAVFRIFLGLGMGGEWASGAALVSETWADQHRGKALGFMQSSWAIGYALAALVNWLVQDVARARLARRVLRRRAAGAVRVLDSARRRGAGDLARGARDSRRACRSRQALGGPMLGITVALALMNACTMFAWWGFNTWVPSYLRCAESTGGIGLSNADDERLHHREPGRHVVRLRDVRLRQRRDRAASART